MQASIVGLETRSSMRLFQRQSDDFLCFRTLSDLDALDIEHSDLRQSQAEGFFRLRASTLCKGGRREPACSVVELCRETERRDVTRATPNTKAQGTARHHASGNCR